MRQQRVGNAKNTRDNERLRLLGENQQQPATQKPNEAKNRANYMNQIHNTCKRSNNIRKALTRIGKPLDAMTKNVSECFLSSLRNSACGTLSQTFGPAYQHLICRSCVAERAVNSGTRIWSESSQSVIRFSVKRICQQSRRYLKLLTHHQHSRRGHLLGWPCVTRESIQMPAQSTSASVVIIHWTLHDELHTWQ